jgi:hypothetical protein
MYGYTKPGPQRFLKNVEMGPISHHSTKLSEDFVFCTPSVRKRLSKIKISREKSGISPKPHAILVELNEKKH